MRYVESLNKALHTLMAADERVYFIGEDVLDPYGGAFKVARGLSTNWPERVLTTPISEPSMTGFATGMALRGLRPVLEIMFGDFLTLCVDQIVNGAAKFSWMYNGQVSVPLVIRTPMGGRRGYGPTHSQTLETLFLGVSGIKIVAPSLFHDPGAMLHHVVLNEEEPVLFIENKSAYPRQLCLADDHGIFEDFYVRSINSSNNAFPTISLRLAIDQEPDVTLLAYGGMATLAAAAALKAFLKEEILVEVLLPSSVKPFLLADALDSVKNSGRVIIAEEAQRTSGWGAEVAAQISEAAFAYLKCPVTRIGAAEVPIPSSGIMEKEALPSTEMIERAIYTIC